MRFKLPSRGQLTNGECALVLSLIVTGLFGAIVGLMTVMRFDEGVLLRRSMTFYEGWVVFSGAVGAAAGLYILRHKIGGHGLRGLLQSLGGLVVVSVLGAVIAGSLALPLYGTMFGPFTLAVILAGSPIMAAVWIANQVAAHLLVQQYHKERDSIFAEPEPDPVPPMPRSLRVSPRP